MDRVGLLAMAATHNGWLYYQGGDQTFFYTISWVLSHGHLPETGIGYSWSFVEAPITAVAGPSFLVGLPAIVLVQVVLLLPLAVVALYGVTKRLLGAGVARLAVAAWILVPFSVIPLFVQRYHGRWVDQTLPQVLGLTGMGDYASMVLLLCAAYLLFRHLDEGGWETAVLAGLVVGFVLGLKPSNTLFLAAPLVGLLIGKRYRGAVAFGLALLPTVVTLIVWKQRGLGQLPLFSSATGVTLAAGARAATGHVAAINTQRYLKFDWAHLQNNIDGLREYFWSNRLVEWIPLAGALGALRVSRAKGAFLAVWLGLFFLIKGSSPLASVDTASFWRLLTPAWPAYFLLGDLDPRDRANARRATRAGRRRAWPLTPTGDVDRDRRSRRAPTRCHRRDPAPRRLPGDPQQRPQPLRSGRPHVPRRCQREGAVESC